MSLPPLLIFLTFILSTLFLSLLTAFVVTLFFAFAFTFGAVILALFVLVPVLFLTTIAANFIFVWSIGAYFAARWFNGGKPLNEKGTKVGDALDRVSNVNVDWAAIRRNREVWQGKDFKDEPEILEESKPTFDL